MTSGFRAQGQEGLFDYLGLVSLTEGASSPLIVPQGHFFLLPGQVLLQYWHSHVLDILRSPFWQNSTMIIV